MRPSHQLLSLLGCFAALALVLSLWRLSAPDGSSGLAIWLWWLSLAGFAIVAIADASHGKKVWLTAERLLPGSFAVAVPNKVILHLQNQREKSLKIEVSDHHPSHIHVSDLPLSLRLAPGQDVQLTYWATPQQRGDAVFGDIDVRIASPLGLWEYRQRFPRPATVKVYPDFTAITHFQQLSHEQQVSQLGVHMLQRRGQGMDFHQLREYRDGDVSRQIDWKASSRRQKLISRDYQDERDQEIIFLLDCGRRMRAKDEGLSHFDHCLNSLLLLSYVALRQGDAVGLLSFAGTQRWLPPIKGKNNINSILNAVYDLHSSTATSDLLEAATELMARHRKRSLVILLSNLREEDQDDVIAASRLLSNKHLVLVVSLREEFFDEIMERPVTDLESTLVYSGATSILNRRQRLLKTLRSQGVLVSDATPSSLHAQLVNEYWALKRSGRI